jgi:hypothetical protein
MGAAVRKGDWYKSYNEFCRIFIEVGPTREDHTFLRALDFFGAFGDPPSALLDADGAESIVKALDDLSQFLSPQATHRATSDSQAVKG